MIHSWFIPFAIVFLNLVIYSRTTNFELVMDDHQWWNGKRKNGFRKLSSIKSFSLFRAWFHDRFYSGTTFGLNTKVEHSFRVFIHTSTCLLIYWAMGNNEVSFWAAILYSCNPINNQTSLWLNGRRYALNVVLVLLMLAFPAFSIFLYPLTTLLQVTAIFSPVLLIYKSPWYLALIPFLLFFGWGALKRRIDIRSNVMADGDLKDFKWSRLIVVVKTFGFFFWKMIIPGLCAMQYPDRVKWGQTEDGNKDAYAFNLDFWKGIGAFVCYTCIACYIPNDIKPWIFFMGLAILQWSAVLPVTQILSDRYCSLPNVFMMFMVSYFAHITGVFYYVIIISLVGYYAVCLSEVLPMYRDISVWYEYHLRHFPSLSWYRHNLISDLMNEDKLEDARKCAIEGLMHDRTDFRLLMWGAIISARKGDLNGAEGLLKEAENNFYINKEKDQTAEIAHFRGQINLLRPIYKKADKLTEKEKTLLLKKHGVRLYNT